MVQNRPMWVMWCTCNVDRAALVNSLSHRVTSRSHADLLSTECQHVLCTRNIAEEIGAIHNTTPYVDFDGKYTEYQLCVWLQQTSSCSQITHIAV